MLTTVPTAAERNGDLTALLGPISARMAAYCGAVCQPGMVPTTEGGMVPARGDGLRPEYRQPQQAPGARCTHKMVKNIIPVAAPMQKLLS